MQEPLVLVAVGAISGMQGGKCHQQIGNDAAGELHREVIIKQISPRRSNREGERQKPYTKANWHFTTVNARVKLNHLYHSI